MRQVFLILIATLVKLVTQNVFITFCLSCQMFVITGFMNILNKAMTDQFPRSIAHVSEGAVSVKRIQVCFPFHVHNNYNTYFQVVNVK
jgi:hypothetical protein